MHITPSSHIRAVCMNPFLLMNSETLKAIIVEILTTAAVYDLKTVKYNIKNITTRNIDKKIIKFVNLIAAYRTEFLFL